MRDLRVSFGGGAIRAVDGVSFDLAPGEVLGVVGESGSGKSVASKAILGLHGASASVGGSIIYDGRDLLTLAEPELRKLRGAEIAMVFQDPHTSLHPFFTIGKQITEAYRLHREVSRKAARAHAIDLLGRVGITDPLHAFDAYPHEYSGGMRQRAMIAMALVCSPRVLIADEPTTALDVTVQAQILDLLLDLRDDFGSAIVLVTHDLGVVAQACDRVLVMYGGRVVERAGVNDLFHAPAMPYTWGLLGSVPRLDRTEEELTSIPGSPPASSADLGAGCAFAGRCAHRAKVPGSLCVTSLPSLVEVGPGHAARCHLLAEGAS